MNIPFLSSLFQTKNESLTVPDSILLKKLKAITESTDLEIYQNASVYHHAKEYTIPLMLLNIRRGIYLFEVKDWSYDDLKNSQIEKAQNQSASKDTLSYQNTQNIIDTKCNELTHHDSVPIFNYLLMENLNADEYEHLDESFKELLPINRVIFSDTSEQEIVIKLEDSEVSKQALPSRDDILGNLFVQHTIVNDDLSLKVCTQEQIKFIESDMSGFKIIKSDLYDDKSSVLLLKTILEKLKHPEENYIIVKPTLLACELLKRKLLDIVEHAIVQIDLTSIIIITPIELVNMHLTKLNKEKIEGALHIDETLMKKAFDITDLIICDDSNLMPDNFIQYLIHIQSKTGLVLVNSDIQEAEYNFVDDAQDKNIKVTFHQANPHAKTLQLISTLLKSVEAKDITVISNSLSQEKLNDDLEFFIKDKALLLDSSKSLINQTFDSLMLLTYSDTNALHAKHVILLDLCFTSVAEIEYAMSIAQNSVDIIYEDECQEVESLRIKYESNNERDGMEEETLT